MTADDVTSRDGATADGGHSVLTSLPPRTFDSAVRLASYITGNANAAIHLLDEQYQHRLSAIGAPIAKDPVESSMCVQVVNERAAIVTADASVEPRFAGNPHTSGDDPVRFYASLPLWLEDEDTPVGTLCVFSNDRRTLTAQQRAALDDLADVVAAQLALHETASQLSSTATHDPLTGLPNRLLLTDRLAQALARRDRGHGDPTIGILDLDKFKAVNDGHGHAAGDRVLVDIGERLARCVRPEDTAARLGGDEFVLLLERAPEPHLAAIEERVRASIEEPITLADGTQVQVGTSIGWAIAQPHDHGYELMNRADEAMYDDKRKRSAGR